MNKLLACIICLLAMGPTWSHEPLKKKPKKLSKQSKDFISDLVIFNEGTITAGRSIARLIPTERDTALLFTYTPKRVKHQAFALSKYEVTNQDYHQFELYVYDSLLRTKLAKEDAKYLLPNSHFLNWDISIEREAEEYKILTEGKHHYRYMKNGIKKEVMISPDQEVWTKDFTYSFNEPMTNMYYWHPAYDKYPVVGVSAEQAEAYCHWYTRTFYQSLDSEQKTLFKNSVFRLPTSLEWESAAQTKEEASELINSRNVFAWSGGSCGVQGNYGSLVDENNYNFKYFSGDGGFHTVKVDGYVAGVNGIHNMSGNVCEWTSTEAQDTIFFNLLDKQTFFLPGESMASIEQKIRFLIPPKNDKSFTEDRIQNYIRNAHHDCEVLAKYKDGVYVKGGSWADPLIYAMIDKKEVYLKDHQSSRIGFRLALDLNEDLLEFLD